MHLVKLLELSLVSTWLIGCSAASCPALGPYGDGGARASVPIEGSAFSIGVDVSLAEGENTSTPCFRAHAGFDGELVLTCSGGVLSADPTSCLRARCLQPDRFVRRRANADTLRPALAATELEGLARDLGNPLWSGFARLADGRLLAAPTSASTVLEIGVDGSVRTFGSTSDGFLKYQSITVAGFDPIAYAVPFFAERVLRINASNDDVTEWGPSFGFGGSKWWGAAHAAGSTWAVPYHHQQVLRVNATSVSTIGSFGTERSKWWEAVLVGEIVVGIPCSATALLKIDAVTGEVETFGGPFSGTFGKWRGAVAVPGGIVYAMPSGHARVLKVIVSEKSATFIGPSFGDTAEKWNGAVLAADGTVFGVPASAEVVLRVDPQTDSVRSIGPVPAGDSKWAGGAFSADGLVIAAPANGNSVLVVDPITEGISMLDLEAEAGIVVTQAQAISKWGGAALGHTGAVYMLPGAAHKVLRVGEPQPCLTRPTAVNVTCVMGFPCNVTLRNANVRASPGALLALLQGNCVNSEWDPVVPVPASFGGWTNPQASATRLLPYGMSYEFGTAVTGTPLLAGAYKLCWGDDPASSLSGREHDQDVGWLTVLGPHTGLTFSCSMGFDCTITIPHGRGIISNEEVLIVGMVRSEEVPSGSWSNPAKSTESGIFPFGILTNADPFGVYELRWGRVAGNSGVLLGSLQVIGPGPAGQVICSLGEECNVTLHGLNMSIGDAITLRQPIVAGCDAAGSNRTFGYTLPGWCGGLCQASAANGSTATFRLGNSPQTPSPLLGNVEIPSHVFVLCWAPFALGDGYEINVGNLLVIGPALSTEVVCELGVACLVNISGYGLTLANRLAIAANGTQCRRSGAVAALASLGDESFNPAEVVIVDSFDGDSTVVVFDVGSPDQGSALTYRLCWEASSVNQALSSVDVGTLQLVSNDCDAPVPLPTESASSPPCLEGAGTTPHLGRCTPRCLPDWDPNQTSPLTCFAGRLSPPTFSCHRRCLVAPEVSRAGEQTHCSNTSHGGLCEVMCPIGFVKSGDFYCFGGTWQHHPDPSLRGDLSYPPRTCFRPCPASSAQIVGALVPPCVATTSVAHGQNCVASCPVGTQPFDLEPASLSRTQLLCRDGGLEPPGFRCLANCRNPVVANAIDLHLCADVVHGETCTLRCLPRYQKTSDLICNDGEFNAARCITFCDLAAIWPTGVLNAHSEPCVGAPDHLFHDSVCRPSCVDGFSNRVPEETLICREGRLIPNTTSSTATPNAPFRCYADCTGPAPTGIVPNMVDMSDTCAGLQHGETCPVRCDATAIASGDILCEDGVYVSKGGSCLVACERAPSVIGAVAVDICFETPHGETCDVQCEALHKKVGSLKCVNGQWEGEDLCKRPCEGDCHEGAFIIHGQNCSRQCPEGYKSDDVAKCADGTLVPATFTCFRDPALFCGRAHVDGASEEEGAACDGTPHGQYCDVVCNSGFKRSGSLQCLRGSWNFSTENYCEDVRTRCIGLPVLVEGIADADCASSLVGQKCFFTCNEGFEVGIPGYVECLEEGAWSRGHCIHKDCGLPPSIPNAKLLCNGVTTANLCEVECDVGYEGSGSLECGRDSESGAMTWRPVDDHGDFWIFKSRGFCSGLSCSVAPFVDNLAGQSCDETPHGSTCSAVNCDKGFRAYGAYKCQLGHFVEVPSCLPESGGAVASSAASASLRVELEAAWGDLSLTAKWDAQAAPFVLEVLKRLLVETGEAADVQILGWSSTQANGSTAPRRVAASGTFATRRLQRGIEVTYLFAAVPIVAGSNGTLNGDATGAAVAAARLALRLKTLLSPANIETATRDALKEAKQLQGTGGVVNMRIVDLASEPTVIAVVQSTPSANPTASPTPKPTAEALGLALSTTTGRPDVASQATHGSAQSSANFFEDYFITLIVVAAMIIFTCAVVCCCACRILCRAPDTRHLMKQKPKKTILKNVPRPPVDLAKESLTSMSKINKESQRSKMFTTLEIQKIVIGKQLGLESDKVTAAVGSRKIENENSQFRANTSQLEQSLVGAKLDDIDHFLKQLVQKEPKAKTLRNALLQGDCADAVQFYISSQSDFELPQELGDDFVQLRVEDEVEEQSRSSSGKASVKSAKSTVSPKNNALDFNRQSSPGGRTSTGTVRSARSPGRSSRSPGRSPRSPGRSPAESPRSNHTGVSGATSFSVRSRSLFGASAWRRAQVAKSALQKEPEFCCLDNPVSMKQQGKSPGGSTMRNKLTVQNTGTSGCKVGRGPARDFNFKASTPALEVARQQQKEAAAKAAKEAQLAARAQRESLRDDGDASPRLGSPGASPRMSGGLGSPGQMGGSPYASPR